MDERSNIVVKNASELATVIRILDLVFVKEVAVQVCTLDQETDGCCGLGFRILFKDDDLSPMTRRQLAALIADMKGEIY